MKKYTYVKPILYNCTTVSHGFFWGGGGGDFFLQKGKAYATFYLEVCKKIIMTCTKKIGILKLYISLRH